ncbi:TPA: methionine adenosyltransferase [Candidatus Uhrbacteria bacterium]|nr:methionine adenosyltransferase [Candidatus Uhrbacteria bacterium]
MPPIYTVESVTSGHPDKICDQISDAILDECLRQDPLSRVAVECFGSHGLLVVGGEVTTSASVNFAEVVRRVVSEIGYDGDNLEVIDRVVKQSPEIARGVDEGGAGDQGIMYGYATDETPEFLPRGVVLAHKLARGLETLRRNETLPWLRPDGKTQVTMVNGRVRTILVSTQHDETVLLGEVRGGVFKHLIAPIIEAYQTYLGSSKEEQTRFIVNPAGAWSVGGFEADTGLTGRKIMVDTYGGLISHGGGCFSGKDATKVDRSGAYMARFVARDLVSRGEAKQCLISVAYAIGVADPVMMTAHDEQGRDLSHLAKVYDFRPQAIIERLDLRKPIFRPTACYGHFGRETVWG